jgi:RNA polymerase sigma-70 factor (ECF subfamily)
MSTARAKSAGQSDGVLVTQAQRGNRQAFDVLVRRHHGYVMSMAMTVVRNEIDAEDVAQSCWLKVVRQLGRFDGRCSFKTWLGTVTIRTAIDEHRRKRPVPHSDIAQAAEDAGLAAAGPDETFVHRQRCEQLARGLGQLNEGQRQVMLMTAEGRSQDEMAQLLEVPRGTVMSRRFVARRRLRELAVDE